jgi:hypothetical protein
MTMIRCLWQPSLGHCDLLYFFLATMTLPIFLLFSFDPHGFVTITPSPSLLLIPLFVHPSHLIPFPSFLPYPPTIIYLNIFIKLKIFPYSLTFPSIFIHQSNSLSFPLP